MGDCSDAVGDLMSLDDAVCASPRPSSPEELVQANKWRVQRKVLH